ncbi:MAG: transposase [Roseburia sp.]
MKKKRKNRRHFDDQFKLSVLKDYYESGMSYYQIAIKYDISSGNIFHWERKYLNKIVPLPSDIQELEEQVFMAKTKKEIIPPVSEEERLRDENIRLRKALEYSELRNEALHEVLKIGREQYGIDLLKKVGAKQ